MARSVPVAQPRSKRDIEMIAMRIILKYQPEVARRPMPFDILRFFDCDLEALTGVRTDYRTLPAGIHGYTDIEAMESVISAYLADDSSQWRFFRTTVAHETGHAGMHVRDFRRQKAAIRLVHNKQDVTLKLYREEDIPAYLNPEWQAWRFAKALLMPAQVVRQAVQSGYTMLNLTEAFDVHPAFVRVRLKDLGIPLDTIRAF